MCLRKWKNITVEEFVSAFKDVDLFTKVADVCHMSDAGAAAKVYNDSMSQAADKLAPLKVKSVDALFKQPWFSDNLKSLKIKRRRAEIEVFQMTCRFGTI